MAFPSSPGDGLVTARLLPPSRLVLPHLEFVYPLKLISTSLPTASYLTIFILSYGGGLVSNDKINLTVLLEQHTKLCLLTQGSTKIFKRRAAAHRTEQTLTVTLGPSSALLLLPDPVQPFADSCYVQRQVLHVDDTASFVLLDWVTEGRTARGEKWEFARFESRNEVYATTTTAAKGKRLLLRDAVVLDGAELEGETLCGRMDGFTCFATLIVRGVLFKGLMDGTVERYSCEPRIGGKGFAVTHNSGEEKEKRRWDVLWTATSVRGFLLVKVSGRDLEEVRGFLKDLLVQGGKVGDEPGDVVREFGEEALMCLQ